MDQLIGLTQPLIKQNDQALRSLEEDWISMKGRDFRRERGK